MGTQCGKKDRYPSYLFSEKINLYPEQRIYQLGDTIWLQHVGNTLYEKKRNQYFSTDTLSVVFAVQISNDYSLPTDVNNIFCDFIFKGKNMGSKNVYNFGCRSGDDFNFKLGMVLIRKGSFSIHFTDYQQVDVCNSSGFYDGEGFPPSNISYQFNISDGHKDLFTDATKGRVRPIEYFYSEVDAKKMYFFKVE